MRVPICTTPKSEVITCITDGPSAALQLSLRQRKDKYPDRANRWIARVQSPILPCPLGPCKGATLEPDESVQDYLLEHAQSPYHRGKCCAATHCHRALNIPCGDDVEFSLRVESGVVREAWFVGRGCVISQTAASMLAQAVEGHAVAEITDFSAQHMLDLFLSLIHISEPTRPY